jgi:hypothetical protein
MTHTAHASCPYYDANQILVDGCAECEALATHPATVIGHMTKQEFEHAWERAVKYERLGLPTASYAEAPVLRIFWNIAVQLERRGIPLGYVPQYHITATA